MKGAYVIRTSNGTVLDWHANDDSGYLRHANRPDGPTMITSDGYEVYKLDDSLRGSIDLLTDGHVRFWHEDGHTTIQGNLVNERLDHPVTNFTSKSHQ